MAVETALAHPQQLIGCGEMFLPKEMVMKRLPMILAGTAAFVKLLTVLAARFGAPGISAMLLQAAMADIPSWWIAETITQLMFEKRQLGPAEGQALVFDVTLLLCGWAEWYVVGWATRAAVQGTP